jgi:FKBP-type peptidyl-prolyl cis-trans isomerase
MRDKIRRIGWISLVILFVVTGLGVGVVGFWQYTHQPAQTGDNAQAADTVQAMKCSQDPNIPEVSATSGKLKGTKLPGFTPTKTDLLKCIDVKVGSGASVGSRSTLTANYTGALAADGVIFESSLDSGQPFTSPLSQLIPGWQKGLLGMKTGGVRRLVIPAASAYGSTPPPGIPANADLVFDISLINTQ